MNAPRDIFEEAIFAQGHQGALNGLHCFDANALEHVVLIIPGSGPTDLNGNNPLGVNANTYKMLATELAQIGIQSVRIDKRGMFSSRNAIPDANNVTISEYADDVDAWIRSIHTKIPSAKIWLLGHSEGGLVAMLSALRNPPVSGLILCATAGQPMGRLMASQLTANPANEPILDDGLKAIKALENGQSVEVSNYHPALKAVFGESIQPFLMDLFSHDPTKMIAKISNKILILQGNRDIQVDVENAMALHNAAKTSELCILAGVNHVLKVVAEESREENVATYGNPHLPIAPEVIEKIRYFIGE